MSLLADLQPPAKVWPCKVRAIVETLDKADAEILLAAVMTPEWKYQTLESALAAKGIVLGGALIKRHRSKECSCWKI
jgi:hypothetical protein